VQRYVSGGIVLEGNLWDTLSQKKYIHAIRWVWDLDIFCNLGHFLNKTLVTNLKFEYTAFVIIFHRRNISIVNFLSKFIHTLLRAIHNQ
jgi:hypothetical protein